MMPHASKGPAKPKRGFMDGYRRYDASHGFGRPDDWIRAAEARLGHGAGVASCDARERTYLDILRIADRPATRDEFKRLARRALIAAHPDHGGTDATARAAIEAYGYLLGSYVA